MVKKKVAPQWQLLYLFLSEFLRPLNDQHDHSFAEEMWSILIV